MPGEEDAPAARPDEDDAPAALPDEDDRVATGTPDATDASSPAAEADTAAQDPALVAAPLVWLPRLTIGLSAFAFGIALLLDLAAILHPHGMSYVEGYLLEQGVRLADGGEMYRPLGEPAWLIDNFPPVYPLLLAVGVKLFGPTFAFGRTLTFLSLVGLVALLLRWCRDRDLTWAVSLGIAALFVLSPFVLKRSMMLRMDLAVLAMSTLALGLHLRWRETHPTRAAVTSALLVAFALGMRQTALAAPVALSVLLARRRAWRELGVFWAVLVAVGVTAVLILQAMTDGRFLEHTVTGNTGRWLWAYWWERFDWMLEEQGMLVVLGAAGAAIAWRFRDDGAMVVAVWWPLALLSCLTAGKVGSSVNHFLELIWVSALALPFALGPVAKLLRDAFDGGRAAWVARSGGAAGAGTEGSGASARRVNRGSTVATADILRLLIVLLVLQLVTDHRSSQLGTAQRWLDENSEKEALEALLEDPEGPVLADEAALLVRTGHEVRFEPRTMLERQLAGGWDDTPLVESIEAQEWSLLLIEERAPKDGRITLGWRWTDGAWAAIHANYEHSVTIGEVQVWVPIEGA